MERIVDRIGTNFDPYVNFWQCGLILKVFGYVKWFKEIFLKTVFWESLDEQVDIIFEIPAGRNSPAGISTRRVDFIFDPPVWTPPLQSLHQNKKKNFLP